MKKIVSIIAAAAVLATSVFAADVSAKVNILGDLFSYGEYQDWNNGGAYVKKMSALGIAEGGQGWNPSFAMSASGDQAGASMKFYDDVGKDGTIKSVDYNIWFKPFDILTVQVGNWTTNLNQETIDYSNTATGIDTDGYALCLNTNGFELDVFLTAPWSGNNFGWDRVTKIDGWFVKDGDADAKILETYIKVAYSADFGTISAYADLNTNQKYTDWGNGGVDVYCPGMDLGIGYKGTFGAVNAFVNGIAGFDDNNKFGIFRGELFVSTNIDVIGISTFIVGGYAADDVKTDIAQDKLANVAGFGNGAFLGATAKITFPAGPFGGYVFLKDDAILADNFVLEVKPGLTKNFGSCAFDIAVDATIQDHFKVDVPMVFTYAW